MMVSSTQKLVVHIVLVEVYQTLAFLTPGQLHPEYHGEHIRAMFWGHCPAHLGSGVTSEYKRDV